MWWWQEEETMQLLMQFREQMSAVITDMKSFGDRSLRRRVQPLPHFKVSLHLYKRRES